MTQEIIQNKRKGRPSIMGSIRLTRGRAKTRVINGRAPRINASFVPFLMRTSFLRARPLYQKKKKGNRQLFLDYPFFSHEKSTGIISFIQKK
jgi:hypothetical protein